MKTAKLVSLVLTLSGVTLACAQAPSESGSRSPHHGKRGVRELPPIVQALDTNHDGEISSVEMTHAPATLKTLDMNDDGIFSPEELLAFRPARLADASADAPSRPARPRPALLVRLALDANADGIISAPEIANAVASLRALDANGDGMLTQDELRPLPPARK